jgi:multiple sugar transport system permease protein
MPDTLGRRRADAFAYLALLAVSAIVLFPFVWIVLTSFKPEPELYAIPPALVPQEPTLDHYRELLIESDFPSFFLNSVIVAPVSTAIALLLGAPAAYGFARFRYRLSWLLFGLIVVARMSPYITLTIPLFVVMRSFGLLNDRLALIITYLAIELPLIIWILEAFFREVPRELEEAAEIDGMGHLGVFLRIVLPLSLPAVSVAAALGLIAAWNEFIFALALTRTPEAQTIPVGLAGYVTSFQIFFGPMSAGATLYAIPVLLFTVLAQRGIVKGLATGGVRG